MPSPTPEAWAEIRYAYEHTRRPVEDICAAHGISSGTLRNRMHRWGWTQRQRPIPDEGPPALAMPAAAVGPTRVETSSPEGATPSFPSLTPSLTLPLLGGGNERAATDGNQTESTARVADHPQGDVPTDPEATAALIAERLQGALARVLPAIEATLARLTASPQHPRETEQAARTLGVLMRTLRELNTLASQHALPGAAEDHDDGPPEDIDEFRRELARRINAFVDDHEARKAAAAAAENGDGSL
jgi:hypothetical protein